ncbi:hypothetical protein ACIRRH_15475 [Kitasatospora sp. NPDC101235]|uniref:hypothetical protein n=1 Tax=Kitasatospora sp. NPDC101235 TaxID=3364101 RepID=UPI003823A6A0
MRLADLGTGRLTWMELVALVRGLPPTSRLAAALTGRPAWSRGEYLLADIWDVLASANWQRGGDRHAPRPKPYPRPGARRDPAERAAALAAARERSRAHRAAVEAGHLT